MMEKSTKNIQIFIINTLKLSSERGIFNHLVKALVFIEDGNPVRGTLSKITRTDQTAHSALYAYIREVSHTEEYFNLTGVKIPVTPVQFLSKLWEKYLLD